MHRSPNHLHAIAQATAVPRPHRMPARPGRWLAALGLLAGLATPAAAQSVMRINISIAQNSHQGVAIDTFA